MSSLRKSFSLVLILIIAISSLSLMMVKPAFAQSIPTPSVPEFTVTLISSSPESHFVNRTIELSIKNQPAISFYDVRMRVNDGNWNLLYPNNNSVPTQSTGKYTILSYSSGFLGVENQYDLGYTSQNLSAGDKVDFQVQAMIGSINRVFNPNATNQLEMYPYVFTGQMSDWSNTQTITIPSSSSSASPTPTPNVPELPTNTVPDTDAIPISTILNEFIFVVVILLAVVVFLLLYRRHRKTASFIG